MTIDRCLVGLAHDLANDGAVVLFDAAAQSIGQQPLGERLDEQALVLLSKTSRRPAGPSNLVPSGRTPEESIGPVPGPAESRHLPRPSKFSSAEAERVHDPVANGASRDWRDAAPCVGAWSAACALASSFNDGTLGGGGGGGVPRSCSSTHLPRIVGAVRFG